MKISPKQIESVIKLNAPERYEYFIKKIVDWEEAWGLYDDGWALAETNDGEKVFLLWPAKEYASLCVAADWVNYKPKAISLDNVIDELIPMLKRDKVLVGVFFVPDNSGITPDLDRFLADLKKECEKYD